MNVIKHSLTFLIYLLTFTCISAKQRVATPKTKICGDDICNKVLFTAKFIRNIPSAHPTFLEASEDKSIEVTAIKFSDRIDIIEGRILGDPTKSGVVFLASVDKGPYVEFLRDAIVTKTELKTVIQNPTSGGPKIAGSINAELDLVRDYNVQAKIYAAEQKLPPPEEFPIPQPNQAHGHSHGAHGHSHGGHGHSHGDHGHSHDDHGHSHDDHGHSHEDHAHAHNAPAETAETIVPKTEVPVITEQPPVVADSIATPEVPVTPEVVGEKEPKEEKPVEKVEEKEASPTPTEVPNPYLDEEGLDVRFPAMNGDKKSDFDIQMDKEIEEMMKQDAEIIKSLEEHDIAEGKEVAVEAEAKIREKRESMPTKIEETIPEDPKPVVEEVVTTVAPPVVTEAPVVTEQPVVAEPPVEVTTEEPVTLPPLTIETVTPSQIINEIEAPSPIPNEPITNTPEFKSLPRTPPAPEATTIPTINLDMLTTTVSPPVEQVKPTIPLEATTAPSVIEATTVPSAFEATTVPSVFDAPPEVASELPPLDNDFNKGVCDGDDCGKIASSPPPQEDPFKANPFEEGFSDKFVPIPDTASIPVEPSVLGNIMKSVIGIVKSIVPVGDLSDAGVGIILNILFVITAFVIYLVSYFLSDNGDSLYFDRRVAHDLGTKNKELQVENDQLRGQILIREDELKRAGNNSAVSQEYVNEINALRREIEPVKFENSQLTNRIAQMEIDFAREKNEKELLESALNKEREKLAQYETRSESAEQQVENITNELAKVNKELVEAHQALTRIEADCKAERDKLKNVIADYDKSMETVRQKEAEISNLKQNKIELVTANEQLKQELKVASEMCIEEPARKDADAAESGGSGGWSDFGDEPEYEEKEEKEEKEKSSPTADIREIIKLKALQSKLEQECQLAKQDMERAVNEKKKIEELYNTVREDLEREKFEKTKSNERADQLLALINANGGKLEERDATCNKLRDDLQKLRENLVELQEEKRQKEDRIKELDAELKKVRADFAKLEHKSFHQVFELKRKLEELQLSQPKAPESSFEMPNLSNTSFDGEAAARPATQELLWADERPIRHTRTMSPQEDFMMDQMPIVKKPSRGRRSDRLMRDPSPSDGERKEKKDGTVSSRRRSRSHGRQPMAMHNFLPGYAPPPAHYDYFGEPLSHSHRRHSRSGHVYYSSGGSNGGRSPPPEMPLIEAQPPPGVRRPRSKRATDVGPDMKPS